MEHLSGSFRQGHVHFDLLAQNRQQIVLSDMLGLVQLKILHCG